MNLWLVDTETLIKAKHSIVSDKKDWYIDALCERLSEVSDNLKQFQEVITDETMITEPEVSDLVSLLKQLKDKIDLLEVEKENLHYEMNELLDERG